MRIVYLLAAAAIIVACTAATPPPDPPDDERPAHVINAENMLPGPWFVPTGSE